MHLGSRAADVLEVTYVPMPETNQRRQRRKQWEEARSASQTGVASGEVDAASQ